MDTIYIYDGSFEGLMSVVFEAYRTKKFPASIVTENNYQPTITDQAHTTFTDPSHAARVLKALDQSTEGKAGDMLYKAFLTETAGVEMLLFELVKLILQSKETGILENYADKHILQLHKLNKQIRREVHRMHAFVRFRKTQDNIYYATIEPDFNVLPLIGEHFEKRFADQQWLIFDVRRKYGIFSDTTKTIAITMESQPGKFDSENAEERFDVKEQAYEALWKKYFDTVNIVERKNKKLHLQHLPRRYWKYLPEKK